MYDQHYNIFPSSFFSSLFLNFIIMTCYLVVFIKYEKKKEGGVQTTFLPLHSPFCVIQGF